MTNPDTIGERILAARKRAGLKQKDLAASLGLTPTALNYYEKNKRNPSIEVLKKLSGQLHVTMDYLLGLESIEAGSLQQALTTGRLDEAERLLGLPPGTMVGPSEADLLHSDAAIPYQSSASASGLSYEDLALLMARRGGSKPTAARIENMARLLRLLSSADDGDLGKVLGLARVLLEK